MYLTVSTKERYRRIRLPFISKNCQNASTVTSTLCVKSGPGASLSLPRWQFLNRGSEEAERIQPEKGKWGKSKKKEREKVEGKTREGKREKLRKKRGRK